MPAFNIRFTGWLLSAAVAFGGSAAPARAERWFQVELLVFAHETTQQSPGGNATAEQWDPTPDLAYPDAARFLVDPDQVRANLARYNARSEVDEFGRQILTILRDMPGAAGGGNVPDIAPRPRASESVDADESVLLPTPFITLPFQRLEFSGKAALMERSGRYSTLFHETWLQPVTDSARALPIVLDRSGDTRQWPRLQGSIRLYLSRYLHLETNLWLNTYGDYLPGTWQMPPPPLGPPALIIEESPLPELENAALDWGFRTEAPGATFGNTSDPDNLNQSFGFAEFDESGEPGASFEETEIDLPVYHYRHAVSLQQRRRMRSSEVHHIDHPLVGVIVKLRPVTTQELQSLGLAESTAGAVQAQ